MPKVLIIEDEPVHAEMCSLKLETKGYVTTCVDNVDEAITLTQEHNYDIVILDLLLPESDGWDFLKYRKKDKKLKDIPLVVVSNLPIEHAPKAEQLGADDYVVKAEHSLELIAERVAMALEKK